MKDNYKKCSISEEYKMNLLDFVKNDNTSKNLNLYELVQLKIQELSNSEMTPKEENLFLILSLSLYFIKDNDFIKEEYFDYVDKDIYKNFNEFLLNPTEEQHKKFLESFENLCFGFTNVYLVCKKIVGNNKLFRDKPLDYFFKIILKDHFPKLKYDFSFPIINDQLTLLSALIFFYKN